MENASKALVMAGGVLIGVLIMSLAVYLFVDFGSTSAKINAKNAEQQLVEFNSKFTSYEGYRDDDGNWKITIYDIITLAGYAKENNDYYEGVDDEQISINILSSHLNVQNSLDLNYKNLIIEYVNPSGVPKNFEYLGVELNGRGKVKSVNFKEV